ncbi:3-isopropylmalate dehydratase small subunit [Novosphingobium mangrovi (ex Hu et al. 2023)]|uniref:3-isopropylmalate dehydratase n=1 Tax=Novosphingobium mangrovi (ex Hu et al. 2023) TaxID=2930094 RepID=A0ABT0AD05_9SPHN|nr:3-isopropylmalate dehydratase small subunit [Novosphingobium mangrovi (ex Hu et al. 2023)]MCJ1961083.1 3-isopropylmalate dehydratase small subunit [Novosphingobium mangrovi (ex Hu et al. 2023)]
MKPFESLTSPVLLLRENRIDTDIIYPARFLLIMQREGLGQYFCADRRVDPEGNAIANPIDEAKERGAGILIAGREFGCGSSREQAVWTIKDFGITCVIAESFGEIFQANCLRNGVLPIVFDPATVEELAAFGQDGELSVDLVARTITAGEKVIDFEISDNARERLLKGWDETGMIQSRWGDAISTFEDGQRAAQPWLYEPLAI